MNTTAKKWLKFFVSAAIVIITLSLLQCLLVPKYVTGIVCDSFLSEKLRHLRSRSSKVKLVQKWLEPACLKRYDR